MTFSALPFAIGVDVGRVLIHPGDPSDPADTSFLAGTDEQAMCTPPMDGAIEALAILVDWFDGNVHIVSKAGPRVAERTRRWFDRHDVYGRSGLARDQVVFCRERREKRLHAVERALTHFVDDRPDVLDHLEGVVPHRFLFGPQRRSGPWPGLVATLTWDDALDAIAASLRELRAR